MHYKNILILLIACVFSFPAFAYLGGGGITLEVLDGLGGGGSKEVGGYTLKDLMGSPVTGVVTDAATAQYKLYIGGIYALQGFRIVEGDWPYGSLPLYVSRSGSDLKITWEAATFIKPQIYVLSGSGTGEYSNSVESWAILAQNGTLESAFSGAYSYREGEITAFNQVGQGDNELYFKGLQRGVVDDRINPDTGITFLADAWCVAKVNVSIEANNGLALIGMPFYAGLASTAFAGLASGQELNLYPRSGSGLSYAKVTATTFSGADFSIDPAVGFWVSNPKAADIVITLVGTLPADSFEKNLASLDLTANPLPLFFNTDLIGLSNDIIYPQSGSGLGYFKKSGSTWGSGFSVLVLKQGFWYAPSSGSNRRWRVDMDTPQAVIEAY